MWIKESLAEYFSEIICSKYEKRDYLFEKYNGDDLPTMNNYDLDEYDNCVKWLASTINKNELIELVKHLLDRFPFDYCDESYFLEQIKKFKNS